MRTTRHFAGGWGTLAAAAIILALMAGCQTAQSPAPTSGEPKATSEVFVVFAGPWALVPDPKDPKSILAVAPRLRDHTPLGVNPANRALEAGVYDLAIPSQNVPEKSMFEKNLFRTEITAASSQRALDQRMERYVIRLPKPDAYVAAVTFRSRVDTKYPPDPSTEGDYATSVSLKYLVSSKAPLTLSGTADAGAKLDPLSLSLDMPMVSFVIEPLHDSSDDPCNTHSRESFHSLVELLGVKLYVDFPSSPDDCHKKDPQTKNSARARLFGGVGAEEISGEFGEAIGPVQMAGFGLRLNSAATLRTAGSRLAAFFFGGGGGACRSPMIVGTN